ncbi:hypothetical protein [Aquifex aeolicus]|uniref:Uncharacterized protein n=1 Tax=Aquifex aeolicus (strain VF5) TaxID=224324 RepID=O67482_AQUAE|nr:hypothetical protein [Aquifex aeolicus]AAC07450.1 putative protein [Aquifex aeolicus VF5]
MVTEVKKKLSKEEKKRLLKLLTYEKVNGKPIYYRDYRKVLRGELPPGAVMGSSGLQAFLIILLIKFLLNKLDDKKFILLSNELSFLYKKGSWRNLDIAIFEKTQELLDTGVEKVIWIFTKPKKVMIVEKGKKWIIQDWNEEFEVMEGIKINLNEILKEYNKEVS